jgi:hypothetical protein
MFSFFRLIQKTTKTTKPDHASSASKSSRSSSSSSNSDSDESGYDSESDGSSDPSAPQTGTLLAQDFSGQTYVAGAYTQGGAASANLPVTLDCAGSQTGFSFTVAGALNINTDVQFKNGQSCPVLWKIGGAVSMSAVGAADATNSHVVGNVEAVGAISINSGVHLAGTIRSQGLVTVSSQASVQSVLPA